MTEKVDEICISEPRTVTDIKEMQKYVKAKGEKATETEIVQVCINLARRLGAGNWSVYLEVKHVCDNKEVK